MALTTEPSADVTVTVSGADDVSVSDGASLTFTTRNYSTAQTVTLSAAEDDDGETDTATVSLTASGGGYASVTGEVMATVTDNDAKGLALSATTVTLTEGGTNTFTVALATEPSADVTVTVTVTVTGADDVSVTAGASLIFTATNYATAQTVTLSAAEDPDGEDDTATVSLTASGGGYASVTGEVTATVTDNDTKGFALTPITVTLTEGATNTFTVALTTEPSADVTVTVAGADDVSVTGGASLTFTTRSYARAQTVTLAAGEDADGDDETATVNLTASGGGYADVTGSVTATVTDNDTKGFALTPTTVTLAEGATHTFTVALATEPSADVTVTVSGADDVSVSDGASLTFTTRNYATAQTVTLSAAEDPDGENDTATVSLTASGGGYGAVTGEVTATVTDNDTKGLALSATTVTLAEGATNTFTVALNTEPSADVAVTVTGADDVSVTAGASLTFTTRNYATAQTVTLAVGEDADGDDDTATVNLTASGGGYADVTGEVTAMVTDNDTKGFLFSATSVAVTEGATTAFTVALTTEPSADVTVTVSGADDVSVTGGASLTFTSLNYATAQTVTLSAGEDADGENDTATVSLAASGGGYADVTGEVTATVTDNDTKGFSLSPASVAVIEGGTGTFTVALTTEPSADVTVTVSGADDVSVSDGASLTFTTRNYATAQTVTLSAAEDPDGENDTATVSLTASGGGYADVTGEVTATVTDNDTKGFLFSATSVAVTEGATTAFTVALTTEPSADVTVTVSGADDVSVTGGASLTFTTRNYARAQTVTLAAAEDDDGENDTATVSLTASGGGYASVTGSVDVTVTDNNTNQSPSFGMQAITDQSYTRHRVIATLTLPRAIGGDGTLTYTLSPAAPAGLTFDAGARTLTGTPTQVQSAILYTYTAIDSDGDTARLTFSITVAADLIPSFGEKAVADQSYLQHTAIQTLALPRASGGDGTLTYSLSPAAPAGLTFDASARTLSGTPTAAQSATPFTYTATDTDGDSVSLTFVITVTADLAPNFGDKTIGDQSYMQHTAIGTLTLPEASGGNGAATYSLSPTAPAGLTFDASARTLTGTPTAAQSATPYTYTATDTDGDTATLTFAITVETDLIPSFGAETIADQSYTQHTAIATLTLPRASGGDGTVTYSLSPAAPAGLTFDAGTRTLTDAPTRAQPATPYTYTATDSDGDSASLTFTITVETLPVPASPSGLAASAGDGQVGLSWADPGNGSILRYQVRFRAGSSFGPSDDGLWQDIPGSSATTAAYTVPGLTNRREYVFQVRAVNASGEGAASVAVTATPEGAVSLTAERQAMSMVLSEVARAMLAGATEMVGERMRARPGTSTLTLAGRQVSGAGWVEPSLDERETGLGEPALGEYAQRIGDRELLRGSAFTLSLSGGEEADGAPEWTMWGRGDVRSFSGRKHRSDWDGSLGSGWLGVDVRASGQVFAGLALSQSRGDVDYQVDAEDGAVETSLTTVWPYLQMAIGDGVEVQVLLGVGNGDAEHRSVEDEVSEAALSMMAGSVGARWPVLSRGSMTLSAVTDAGAARMETEEASALVLDGVKSRVWRVRGGLEAAHAGMAITGSQWWLAPRGVVTVRRDGGDGVTGTGVELGGGVRFWGPAPRLSVDASGHWLGLHSDDGVREWSARIEAGLAPGAGGRGLSWTLGPRWGVEREGMLESERAFHRAVSTGTQDSVFAARAGYGMGTAGGRMTPYAEMELGGGEDGVAALRSRGGVRAA